MKRLLFLSFLLITLIFTDSNSQSVVKQLPSPLSMVTYKYADTYIKITYCRPSKKDRNIFGDLVPYGKVWRTGANEATEITITQDILIAGDSVKAGTYTVFTIPEKNTWILILNKELGQWGAFKYNPEQDYKRFTIQASTMPTLYEAFAIEFETIDPKQGLINALLKWDKTKVTIPIQLSK